MLTDKKTAENSNNKIIGRQNSDNKKTTSSKWKYPKIPINDIYKKKFELFPKYKIKDLEQTQTTTEHNKDIYIEPLNDPKIMKMKKHYKFLHLGLIQVAVKPLARVGIGAPVVVCLRDNRHRDFHNSLLAMVELDSTNGPFYFNCSPNLVIPVKDNTIRKLLSLQIKTNGVPLALSYRVVVKGMQDLDDTTAMLEYTPGESYYFQSGGKSLTKWDQVHVPESWLKLLADLQEREDAIAARAATNVFFVM